MTRTSCSVTVLLVAAALGGSGCGGTVRSTAQEPITFKMQSQWSAPDIFQEVFLDWGKKVEEMSGGRLRIDIVPVDTVVPGSQLLDAVSQGTLDGGHSIPVYWFSKNVAASLFGTGPPFALDGEGMLGWMYYGGGQELYNELLQSILNLNVVAIPHGPMPTQPLGWFNNPISQPQDLAGQRFRTVGLAADVFTQMGAAAVILPANQIVAALERGDIDAAEFNNPSSDRALGLPDVRKVMMAQSYHEPGEFFELLINKSKYESLAPDLQAIIKYATMATSADFTWRMLDRNSKDLAAMQATQGVHVYQTSPALLAAQLQACDAVVAERSKDNPFFQKVVDSQRQWATRVASLQHTIVVNNDLAYQHYFPAAEAAGPVD